MNARILIVEDAPSNILALSTILKEHGCQVRVLDRIRPDLILLDVYDVWGDTVNTASRLESHGLPGRVQVSETVVERLRGRFEFEPRGLVELKGRDPMHTYFLLRATP